MSTPQASKAATTFYKNLQTLSDLELQVSDSETIPVHSAVLAQKSLWFKDICVKSNHVSNQTVRLPDLDSDTFMHFFSSELSIDDKRRGEALIAMLLFCYIGSYGKSIESIVLREQYESTVLLHMYEYLLSRLYGIESLEAYSFEQIKSMAGLLRALRSETYYAILINILCYDGFEAENALLQFASAEFEKLNDAKIQRTWSCISCDTWSQVSYLKRPCTAARFALDKCPNCAGEEDEGNKDTGSGGASTPDGSNQDTGGEGAMAPPEEDDSVVPTKCLVL